MSLNKSCNALAGKYMLIHICYFIANVFSGFRMPFKLMGSNL